MLEGESNHEDSAGHKGTIVAGGVQWMCAGKGSTSITFLMVGAAHLIGTS